jgi:hypothetical protein
MPQMTGRKLVHWLQDEFQSARLLPGPEPGAAALVGRGTRAKRIAGRTAGGVSRRRTSQH